MSWLIQLIVLAKKDRALQDYKCFRPSAKQSYKARNTLVDAGKVLG
jgi:hypothetical protein